MREGEPKAIPEPGNTYICLYLQGDGNFRVLRSDSQEDCNDNIGEFMYHSGFSLPLPGSPESYYTRMQHNGQLITRQRLSNKAVWKTDSKQNTKEKFSLVLNQNDTLSILDQNGTEIWNSANGKTSVYDRPLTLMRTYPGYPSRVWYIRPIQKKDRLLDTYICLVQQGDGNFRVVRGDGCMENEGSLVYQSGLSKQLPNNEKYWTHLQRDGNLVTRRELTKKWEWATCSHDGEVNEDFSLVISKSDSLQILNQNGDIIWESDKDETCFAG